MVTSLSELQLQKAKVSISFTDVGMVIPSSEVQSMKALSPIYITPSGIVIFLGDVQPENAYCPIVVTDSGINVVLQIAIRVFVSVSIMALQPSRESYTGLPSATTTLSSDVQSLNT